MAYSYKLIASSTAGSGGVANFNFTSIPATYTDLLVLFSGRSDRATGNATICQIEFNGNTSSYTWRHLGGDGSTAYSDNGSSAGDIGYTNQSNNTASMFGNFAIYIPNYAGSTNKSYSSDYAMERDTTTTYYGLVAGLWSNTAAITAVKIKSAFNFLQYSTAYLYGISSS